MIHISCFSVWRPRYMCFSKFALDFSINFCADEGENIRRTAIKKADAHYYSASESDAASAARFTFIHCYRIFILLESFLLRLHFKLRIQMIFIHITFYI